MKVKVKPMNTPWLIHTRGDPLNAVRQFLVNLWAQAQFEGMLVPVYQPKTERVVPQLLETPAQLAGADPLAPLEIVNSAKKVSMLTSSRPGARFAAVLRPCEMRALWAMITRGFFELDPWFIIGIDCLGAFPAADYLWRMERAGGADELTRSGLRFASQGGIAAYRHRQACQMCETTDAQDADINIGVLGLPAHKYIFITPGDEQTAAEMQLIEVTDGPALREQIARRIRILGRVRAVHQRSRHRIRGALPPELPRTIANLIQMIAACAPCRACLDACPIYGDELDPLQMKAAVSTEAVTRWVAFCAQCGVCQDACPKGTPLAAVMGSISQKLNLANPSLAI